MTAPDLLHSPHGETREHRVECRRCSAMTANWAAVCDRCHTVAARRAAVAGMAPTEGCCNRCGLLRSGRGGLCWQCIADGHVPGDWSREDEF